jgi:hypothetical protein
MTVKGSNTGHSTETHTSNRYDELSPIEQTYFDRYINAVASGRTPDCLSQLLHWLDQAETHRRNSNDYKHARAMVRHYLAILASPDDPALSRAPSTWSRPYSRPVRNPKV